MEVVPLMVSVWPWLEMVSLKLACDLCPLTEVLQAEPGAYQNCMLLSLHKNDLLV